MDEWEASEADNLDQRFSSFPRLSKAHHGRYSFHRSNPCQLQECRLERDTWRHIPSSILFLLIFCCFALENPCNTFQSLFLLKTSLSAADPFDLTTALGGGGSAESSSFWTSCRGRSDACRRCQKTGKAPGLNSFLGSRFENHCA